MISVLLSSVELWLAKKAKHVLTATTMGNVQYYIDTWPFGNCHSNNVVDDVLITCSSLTTQLNICLTDIKLKKNCDTFTTKQDALTNS